MQQGQLSETFKGMAGDGFDREAVEAAIRMRLAEQTRHELSVSGDARSAGQIETSSGLGAQYVEESKRKEEENKRTIERAELIMLQAQQAAAYYGEIADNFESQFEAEYGPQWREHMALQVLDEDEMPLRHDGESMADYEARVEQALMDRLLDEDGNIKPEYQNHPEYREWAEWAKARHHERVAQDYIAKRSSLPEAEQAQLDEQFAQSSTYEEARQSLQEASMANESLAPVESKIDHEIDKVIDLGNEGGFTAGPG